MPTLIKDGIVFFEDGARESDLLLAEGKIEAVGSGLNIPSGCEIVDASGLAVLPGFIDFHTHIDDSIGGITLADDYRSGSAAAVLSGITTLLGFVTQKGTESLLEAVQASVAKVKNHSYCDVSFHLTPTRNDPAVWEEIQYLVSRGYKTFKFYTTYREAGLYCDDEMLEQNMKRLAALDARVLVHCEDQITLDKSEKADLDPASPLSHAIWRPPRVEVSAIKKVLALTKKTGVETHVVHVSTAEGISLIDESRKDLNITCETAPHYLFLNDLALTSENGHRMLCTPPFRREANRAALEQHAVDGKFDLFATDHCAFGKADKDHNRDDVKKVPKGIPGVGALVPLMYELLVDRHCLSLTELTEKLAQNPARLAGLYPRKGTIREDSDADIVLLGRDGTPHCVRSSLADCYETYPDKTTPLDFKYVFLRGKPVVKDNMLFDPKTAGGEALWTV